MIKQKSWHGNKWWIWSTECTIFTIFLKDWSCIKIKSNVYICYFRRIRSSRKVINDAEAKIKFNNNNNNNKKKTTQDRNEAMLRRNSEFYHIKEAVSIKELCCLNCGLTNYGCENGRSSSWHCDSWRMKRPVINTMFEVLQRWKQWYREVFVYTQVLKSSNKMEYVDNSNEDCEKVILSE